MVLLQNPYQTNLLVAGYDEDAGAELYWLDYLATMHKMNIAGTGYGKRLCCTPASPEPGCLQPDGKRFAVDMLRSAPSPSQTTT